MSTITTITSDNLTARIDSQGAQLMGLALDGAEYLWQGDERWWPRRAPVLFPIVGVLRAGHATSAQGDVTLGRHGLARNYEHTIVDLTSSSVTYELCSTPETRHKFPYDFRLNMRYALEEGRLEQAYTVTNTGDVPLPYTLGAHPAFNVPAPGCKDAFDSYELRFAHPWTSEGPAITPEGLHDFAKPQRLVKNSDRLPLSHALFSDLLTVTLADVPNCTATLVGPEGHGVTLQFPGFGYLGVWSASETAPFVAVEPWVGCATALDESDVFEDKRGMLRLQPGQSATHALTIKPF